VKGALTQKIQSVQQLRYLVGIIRFKYGLSPPSTPCGIPVQHRRNLVHQVGIGYKIWCSDSCVGIVAISPYDKGFTSLMSCVCWKDLNAYKNGSV